MKNIFIGWCVKISNNVNSFIYELLLYLFVFIIPVILYLKLKDNVNPLDYLKLNNNVLKGISTGLFVSMLFIMLLLIKKIIIEKKPINLDIGIFWISGALVGILEEIPFRGFILQKLLNYIDFWLANLITTILFVAIHIPTWIATNNIISATLTVSLASLVLGYLFKEYDSLWVPIIIHSVFNLSVWIGLR